MTGEAKPMSSAVWRLRESAEQKHSVMPRGANSAPSSAA